MYVMMLMELVTPESLFIVEDFRFSLAVILFVTQVIVLGRKNRFQFFDWFRRILSRRKLLSAHNKNLNLTQW
jgi:hypothetical protein